MTNSDIVNNDIVIDENTGISVEEQQEILSQINGITEKNRRLLSENAANSQHGIKKAKIDAKKSGMFFPLTVNVIAAAALAVGVIVLVSHNNRLDTQVRTGGAVFNITERALIDEIRKDTAAQIAVKEMEISLIALRMEAVDEELYQLHTNNITLNAEQIAARERLLAMQDSYRGELSALQEERSQILEASRAREARLRAQLEERTREFAAAQQLTAGELDSAINELNRLTTEQERIAAIDAHLAGGVSMVNTFIQNAHYDEASYAVANLRDFVNNNVVTNARSFQSRREFYNQTLALMNEMITDARRNSGSGNTAEQFELQSINIQLQERITSMQRTIDAFSAGSSGQAQRIGELEEDVSLLRSANASLEHTSAEKDSRISLLEIENTSLLSNLTELRSSNTAQEQEIANLRNQITIIRQALQED